jgi:serine/threonine-protein kinase
LSLVTDPPGAEVELFRLVERGRQLRPEAAGHLAKTPLVDAPLQMGSQLLVLRAPGCVPVRYPVLIDREGCWDGTPPGGSEPAPIRLPELGELATDDVYVPRGWYRAGDDLTHDRGYVPVWLDSFVIRRHPVTNGELLVWLNELVATGREDEALEHVPKRRAGPEGELGAPFYGRDEEGAYVLSVDSDGDAWLPDQPVFYVTWWSARAYASWVAEKTGLPWRLPHECEWEKAARGVDGREFPWGNFSDQSWACTLESTSGRPLPTSVTDYPEDESIYGVRGMGGNVADWTADVGMEAGPSVSADGRFLPPEVQEGSMANRATRGGASMWHHRYSRCAHLTSYAPGSRAPVLGFRIARGIDET